MVPGVDRSLEALLREQVPLPAEVADVSFEPPDGTWGASLSRITVNLFLFDVARSPLPPRPPARRDADGGVERRRMLPLVRLSYLVSAWAGSVEDEHAVLGDVLRCFLEHDVLPPAHAPEGVDGQVLLTLSQREGRKPGELWQALSGTLKPSFELDVTVAPVAGWQAAAPLVARVAPATTRLLGAGPGRPRAAP